MKIHLLLSALALGSLTAVNAQSLDIQRSATFQKQASFQTHILKSTPISNGVLLQEHQTSKGRTFKSAILPKGNNKINPKANNISTYASTNDGVAFIETFEDWDGNNIFWLPEGWEVKRTTPSSSTDGWTMAMPQELIPSKCLAIDYSSDNVNEWAITPQIMVEQGMQLSFDCLPGAAFYFDWNYLNDDYTALTEKHIINDLKIHISTDNGANWTLVKSLAEDYIDTEDFSDLYSMAFKPITVKTDLTNYYGKKIKIGFQYIGYDGQTTFIDNIRVGLPVLDVSYDKPAGSLFYGLTEYDEAMPVSILAVPMFKPVTFTNTSKNINTTYSWTYTDVNGDTQTSDEQKKLAVTYETSYSESSELPQNIFQMPVLTAKADGAAPTDFTYNYRLQAGGRGEVRVQFGDNDYQDINLGYSLCDPVTDGTATIAEFNGMPYFGYDKDFSDDYWTYYTFGNETEYGWSKLVEYGNLMYPSEAPLVIDGIHALGYGTLSPGAQFTAKIYMSKNMYPTLDMSNPTYTATCSYNDMTITDRGGINDIISVNFRFDEPIVISKETCTSYFVSISGFNDPEHVAYFSPEMSRYDSADGLAYGWIGKLTEFMGEVRDSWSAVYDYTSTFWYKGEQLVSFYIMLDAAFPWLEGDVTEISVGNDPVTIALDSYYEGSQLVFEGLPSWLEAKADGRYNKTAVTFKAHDSGEAKVTIKAPGVSKTIKINSSAAIGSIIGDNADAPVEYYNMQGIRINNPGKGQVVIKRQGLSAEKLIIR